MKTAIIILSLIGAAGTIQFLCKRRAERKHFIKTLKVGQHVRVRKKINGENRIYQTWVRAVNRDEKTAATPLGQFHFDKILK